MVNTWAPTPLNLLAALARHDIWHPRPPHDWESTKRPFVIALPVTKPPIRIPDWLVPLAAPEPRQTCAARARAPMWKPLAEVIQLQKVRKKMGDRAGISHAEIFTSEGKIIQKKNTPTDKMSMPTGNMNEVSCDPNLSKM